MLNFWKIADHRPLRPDCLVVISYSVKNKSEPTRQTKALIEEAYKWWKNFPQAKVIMSTGDNQGLGVPNSTIMADYALSLGLPRKNIIEEDKSSNTYENLLYSEQIIQKEGFKQPTLVVLDLHSRRAVTIAKKLGWKNLHWITVFSEAESGFGNKAFQTSSRSLILIYEMLAYVYNMLQGELSSRSLLTGLNHRSIFL
ncbi:MAG: YdcF family protein [bacterium]|nr:YdcF family protein [bacterium]